MTDPRSPDGLDPDAFDGLGLESLTEGVAPTRTRWLAIDSAASTRRRRRTGVLSAAAVVLLVVGVAAVLLTRQDSVDIATGGDPRSADVLPVHLLPPEDAEDVEVNVGLNGASISYRLRGAQFGLAEWLALSPSDGREISNDDLRSADSVAADGGEHGQVWVYCTEHVPSVDESGSEGDGGTSAVASWVSQGVYFSLGLAPQRGAIVFDPCSEIVPQMGPWVSELRIAGPNEWSEFLSSHEVRQIPAEDTSTSMATSSEAAG